MISLNLPSFEYKVKKVDGKILIFDVIRKKYVVLTPEEWVRQHFLHYMISDRRYPRALIKIETGLVFNTLQKRCDITVYSRDGKPWLLVECKSPDVQINQRTLHQASVYNSTIQASYIVLTNGLKHICCVVDGPQQTLNVIDELPEYGL